MTFTVSSSDRTPSTRTIGTPRRRLLAAAIALACLGGLSLSVDLEIARWCKAGHIPKEFMRFLNFSEVFAHGIGVATLLLTAAVLDPTLAGREVTLRVGSLPMSRDFIRMAITAFAGGILVNLIKLTLVDRIRPRAANLEAAVSALSTFGNSIATNLANLSHSDINSFPSGHAAVAAGFAAALSWKYPRGTWLFVTLATTAAAQRVASSAHYPSDVLLGAALGLVGAAFLLGNSKPDTRSLDTTTSPVAH
jgi:membrane-associated phospholipid phosphatase